MGIFKRLIGAKPIVVDPADLTLPEVIPTDKQGIVLRKAPGEHRVDIDIVGESFRPQNVAAVAAAAQGKRFDIYLLAEPNNPHDKRAVAVVSANVILGYIAKPANKQWFARVGEAFLQGQLLWGTASIAARPGTNNMGVFGYIYMPRVGKQMDEIITQQLSDTALTKAIEKMISLANTSVEPDTVAQVRSLAKKASAAAAPLAAHAKWVEEQDESNEQWAEVMSLCDSIFEDALHAAYITDEMEIDVVGPIEQLAEVLVALRTEEQ